MIITDRVREIYARHVRALTVAERLQLVALVAEKLTNSVAPPNDEPLRDVMEFHGVGHDNPVGMDAQEYVNQLRGKGGEPLHDIMEFRGAGRDSSDGTDAQAFVQELRAEWDHRS